MPNLSHHSWDCLKTCHPDLQRLFTEVIRYYDFSVLAGHRNKEDQDQAFNQGKSKLKWPLSPHNQTPSMAIDIVPYPVDWNNLQAFYHLAGFVRATACQMGIKIRWGGDWDNDFRIEKQSFNDLPHFELI